MQQNKNDWRLEKETGYYFEKQSQYCLDTESEQKTEAIQQEYDRQISLTDLECQSRPISKQKQLNQDEINLREPSKTKSNGKERWKTNHSQDKSNYQNYDNKKIKKQNIEYNPQLKGTNDENNSKFKPSSIIDNDSPYKKQIKIPKSKIQIKQLEQEISPNEIEQIKREETIIKQISNQSTKQEPLDNLKYKEKQLQLRRRRFNYEKKSLLEKYDKETQAKQVKVIWRNLQQIHQLLSIHNPPRQHQQMNQKKNENFKHLPQINLNNKNQKHIPSINETKELEKIHLTNPKQFKIFQNNKYQQGQQQKFILPKINQSKK